VLSLLFYLNWREFTQVRLQALNEVLASKCNMWRPGPLNRIDQDVDKNSKTREDRDEDLTENIRPFHVVQIQLAENKSWTEIL
jgi:hypothetical protein